MNAASTALASSRVGRWAGGLALGCAAHCLAMPLLVAVLPVLGMSFLLDRRIEVALVNVSVILAVASLCWGYRIHRKRRALFLLGAAVALIFAGRFYGAQRHQMALVLTGTLTLAISQFLNRTLCRSCTCSHHPNDPIKKAA